MRRTAALLLFWLPLISACSSGSGATRSASAAEDGTDTCTATFTWWQKDAYKSTAGRTSPLWPPHTTTELQVTCGDQQLADVSMTNHGTAIGAVDANGDTILVQMRQSDPVTGTRDDMNALVAAYQACNCEAATQFLSTGDASGIMQQVLVKFADYMSQNLQCPDSPSTSDIVGMVQNGDYSGAADAIQQCSWNDGTSFEDGLQQAASDFLAATGDTLDGYHVCNNDAQLQAGLFSDYANGNGVGACDATSSVCSGPAFFYNP
jgi:hypothetical protein